MLDGAPAINRDEPEGTLLQASVSHRKISGRIGLDDSGLPPLMNIELPEAAP